MKTPIWDRLGWSVRSQRLAWVLRFSRAPRETRCGSEYAHVQAEGLSIPAGTMSPRVLGIASKPRLQSWCQRPELCDDGVAAGLSDGLHPHGTAHRSATSVSDVDLPMFPLNALTRISLRWYE